MRIQSFITSYSSVIEIIKKHGFIEPVLFKGFGKREEHNFNLLLKDSLETNAEADPQIHRISKVYEILSALLQCKIVISTPEKIKQNYLRELHKNNSVSLTETCPKETLIRVFGNDWIFNANPSLPSQTLFSPPAPTNISRKEVSGTNEEEKIEKLLRHLELNSEVLNDIKEHPEILDQLKRRLLTPPSIPVK